MPRKKRKLTYLVTLFILLVISIISIYKQPIVATILVSLFFILVFFQKHFYRLLNWLGMR